MRLIVSTVDERGSATLTRRLKQAGLTYELMKRNPECTCPPEPLYARMPEYVNRPEFCRVFQVKGPRAGLRQALEQEVEEGARVWFPERTTRNLIQFCYVTTKPVRPRHPIYVISKGRWETSLTVRALDRMGVPHRVVVEPSEAAKYAEAIGHARLLVLPSDFSKLNQGSIPARNFVWDHAVRAGARRHWIMDDNIRYFFRRNHNMKIEALTGAVFRAMEDYVERFRNVPIAGPQYDFFVPDQGACKPPLTWNTRVYSCLLLDHHALGTDGKWRGKYNEDTDLCLRALKRGHCTLLFNAFLQKKIGTMVMRGGNTDALYAKGRLDFVRSLVKQHPDVARHVIRYGRDHHHVDYSAFQNNQPIPKTFGSPPDPEYGMRLVHRGASSPRHR